MRARLLALAVLLSACGGAAPAPPRNLLIVCVDTLRADELGAYGASPSRTPALDQLAAESQVFERAHAAASWTLPSVGALFTSQFPSTTRLWNFESRLSASFPTLAEHFLAAGYDTYGIASHVYFNADYGLQQGFAGFDDELCHTPTERGWQPITSPAIRQKACAWLASRAASQDDRPWLLFVHFFDPHVQYLDHEAARPDDPSRPERERYRSEIAFTDGHVGAVLAALEKHGFAARTNVLFFSDHGESFAEHPPIQRHSYSLYEEELRVPLLLRIPGLAPRRVSEFVRTVDLLPTLLALHGLPEPERRRIEGTNLLPLLHGERVEGSPLLAEIRLKDGHHVNALVRGRHKLIENVSRQKLELYDLEADPQERVDLAAREPELVRELEAALRGAQASAAERGKDLALDATRTPSASEVELLKALGYGGADEDEKTGGG